MKIVKYIFLVLWTIWCIVGIAGNYSHYKANDWMFIIPFVVMPYLILWYLAHRKAKKDKRAHQNIIEETPTIEFTSNMPPKSISEPINQSITQPASDKPNVKSESSVYQSEISQKILNEPLNQLDKAPSSENIAKATVQQSDAPIVTSKSGISYIEDDKMIARTDGKEITDAEIPYLIQAEHEEVLQTQNNSSNPKFHRTAREEDLSFNFEMKYGNEISVLTEKFESLYRDAYKTNDFDKRIALLKETIKAFEKAKKFCYSKGKGGTIYFQDMWEHLHNSHNQCFSYLDNVQASLEDTIYLKDEVVPDIIDTISKNDGILQRNIYKMLPDIDKSTIQNTLKLLESENILSRSKKGNSYELHISIRNK